MKGYALSLGGSVRLTDRRGDSHSHGRAEQKTLVYPAEGRHEVTWKEEAWGGSEKVGTSPGEGRALQRDPTRQTALCGKRLGMWGAQDPPGDTHNGQKQEAGAAAPFPSSGGRESASSPSGKTRLVRGGAAGPWEGGAEERLV